MSLTGSQRQQLQSALLAAFDEDSLRRLVTFELGEDLDALVGKGPLNQRVFDLVAWADKSGRVSALIDGSLRQNPTNSELQTLAEAFKTWPVPPAEPDANAPYQGLAYFDVPDADRFFGRETLTAELVGYLNHNRFMAVVGASGSGKSSVVRAGLVPVLRKGATIKDSDRWAIFIVTPTTRPLESLAVALTHDSESMTAAATLADDMAKDTRSLGLYARRLTTGPAAPQRIVLVIDQFEELFTLCKDNAERKAFVDNLLTASTADGATTVILTLRADFYAHCAQFDNLRLALQESQKYIGPMSPDELRAAIESPAAKGGWDVEPGLTNRLLKDVSDQPGSLPLLSHALLETWKRRSGRMLTLAGYEDSGGVQGAIAHTADDVYAALSPEQQTMVRNVFVRLTSLGEGVQDTRRRVRLDELMSGAQAPQMEEVLKWLEDARLVTAEKQQISAADGVPEGTAQETVYVDVAHEALIRQWPKLRGWLGDDREALRVHRRLTEASDEWEELRHDPGSLFRGALLVQTAEWAKTHDGDLNDKEREFLTASQAQVEAEQQRELANAKRVRNLLVGMLAVVGVALVLAMAGIWYVQGKNVEVSAANATAEANYKLASDQLKALEGERLFAQAKQFKTDLRVSEAISSFRAAAAYPKLGIDLSKEISDTLRHVATAWVQEGEALLRETSSAEAVNDSPLRRQAIISATAIFSQALDLQPPSDTPVYVWIEPGEFLMGSSDADDQAQDNEKPQHTVWLDGYWIQRTEVTNAQYKRCVDAGACDEPNNERWNKEERARRPVTDVDWNQAQTFCTSAGGRLPTEAEWEKAARGTDGRIYPWGDTAPDGTLANFGGNEGDTTAVGSYRSGASPYGVMDMAGNVWEWTADWYGETYYKDSPERNPAGPAEGATRVRRGGSWDYSVLYVRAAPRYNYRPDVSNYDSGFRCVRSP